MDQLPANRHLLMRAHFLVGHGTIGGNLSNSGSVGPGDSLGTLTVASDYTQNAAGTLRIQVGGLGANQHDLLAVNGHVTLGGTLQLLRLGGFNLQPGNQIVFLTAQKGISGAFNTIQNDFATGTIVQGVVVTSSDCCARRTARIVHTDTGSHFDTKPGGSGEYAEQRRGQPGGGPLDRFPQ
jgi:outer membrane autotransporter barrel domain